MLVAGPTGAPFVVGDDDQSIYRWRGARVENLQRFQQDYPGTRSSFRLEQNYRSTGNILDAANALIAQQHRPARQEAVDRGRATGEPIKLYAAFNERDEAEFVINRIREWIATRAARGATSRSCIARTRSRACSKKACIVGAHSVPRVRRPAVLRARGNQGCARVPAPHHEPRRRCVVRARREPAHARHRRAHARGRARAGARAEHVACGDAAARVHRERHARPKRASEPLCGFLKLIEQLDAETRGARAARAGRSRHQSERARSRITKKEKADRGEARVENLNELVSAGARLRARRVDSEMPPLAERSSRTRCSSPAKARPRRGKTACR